MGEATDVIDFGLVAIGAQGEPAKLVMRIKSRYQKSDGSSRIVVAIKRYDRSRRR